MLHFFCIYIYVLISGRLWWKLIFKLLNSKVFYIDRHRWNFTNSIYGRYSVHFPHEYALENGSVALHSLLCYWKLYSKPSVLKCMNTYGMKPQLPHRHETIKNHTHTQSPQRAFYSIVSKFITIGNTHNQNISLKNNNVTVKTQIYTHSNKYIRALAVSDDGSKAIFYYTSRPGWLSMSMQQRAVEWILILRCSLHTSSTHASNTL